MAEEYICKYCGAKFESKQKLAGHVTYCKLNPNYEENIKKIAIARNAPRKKIHYKEGEFICQYCGRICKNLNSLRQHELRCKENPDCINFITTNFDAYNKSDKIKLRKPSNQFIFAEENGLEKPCVSEETRKKIGAADHTFTEERKRNLSKIMKAVAKNNPSYSHAHKSPVFKRSFYNGFWMDSSWERIFAEYLDSCEIRWVKPRTSFNYIWENEEHAYYPDFYLIDYNRYVEVKGHESERDRVKYKTINDLIIVKDNEIKQINKSIYNIFEFL